MAIVVNLKEQRCLQKCLQTIDMEQTYATKILDLDHRILKIYFKRLKEKVSRIRSNLSTEEILYLKKLETEGKLKASYIPVASNSSLKIAAAYRRLKLQPICEQHSSKTVSHQEISEKSDIKLDSLIHFDEDQEVVYKPIKSLSTAGETQNSNKSYQKNKRKVGQIGRPLTSSLAKERHNIYQPLRRPSTAPLSARALFSSHSGKDEFVGDEDHCREDMSSQWSRDCDIGSNLGENLYEEKRKERLQFEVNKGKMLDRKTKDFLDHLNQFVSCPLRKSNSENSADKTAFLQKSAPDRSVQSTKSLSFDFNQNGVSRDEYQEELMSRWKDLSKCRYLRVADELLDLSGVVNLAKDQMKHFVNIHGFGLSHTFKSWGNNYWLLIINLPDFGLQCISSKVLIVV